MRDPRNWVRLARPSPRSAIGSARRRRRSCSSAPSASATSAGARPPSAVDLAGRTLRDLAREARRVADDVF